MQHATLPFDRALLARDWLDENGYVQMDLRGLEFLHRTEQRLAQVFETGDGLPASVTFTELSLARVVINKAKTPLPA